MFNIYISGLEVSPEEAAETGFCRGRNRVAETNNY